MPVYKITKEIPIHKSPKTEWKVNYLWIAVQNEEGRANGAPSLSSLALIG
jgi:hypothetical protein